MSGNRGNRGAEGGQQTGDDEGFAEDDAVEEEAMEVVNTAADTEVDEVLNGPKATVYYAVQAAPEAEQQGKDYTRDEVEQLMQSEAYQRKIDTCHLCHKIWLDGTFTEGCEECGGFAMTQPCPLCKGRCGVQWKRNVKKSHAYHKAYWDGECGAPALGLLTDSTEDRLTEGLQDLSCKS